jgi:hypothetical protein
MTTKNETGRGPYHVEVETVGCEHCAGGRQWTVVDPDDVAISMSFELEEDADDIAVFMNIAYEAGASLQGELLAALKGADSAFTSWQCGQIPGRPEDILALITAIRDAISRAEGREA